MTVNDNKITKYENDNKRMRNDKELINDKIECLVGGVIIKVKYRKNTSKKQINTF